jgi:hypothetical protein
MKITPIKPDRASIDPSADSVVRHWAKKLGKTKEEIVAAINKVGNNAESIKRELGYQSDEKIDETKSSSGL